MNKLFLLSVFLLVLCMGHAQALQKPTRLSTDARIEKVTYSHFNVVPLYGKPFTNTQIVFGRDEVIQNVQNGDLAAWTVAVNKGMPYMLFVKPTAAQSDTNMIVVTSQHTYYFELHVIPKTSKHDATYAIHFVYPDAAEKQNAALQTAYSAIQKAVREKAAQSLKEKQKRHWNYSFWGDKTLIPVHMYDNEHQTFLQLQSEQSVPAVFAVTSASGDEQTVNFRQEGNMLIIDQVAPEFILRQGKDHVAALFNNTLINKLTQKNIYPQGPSHE